MTEHPLPLAECGLYGGFTVVSSRRVVPLFDISKDYALVVERSHDVLPLPVLGDVGHLGHIVRE